MSSRKVLISTEVFSRTDSFSIVDDLLVVGCAKISSVGCCPDPRVNGGFDLTALVLIRIISSCRIVLYRIGQFRLGLSCRSGL